MRRRIMDRIEEIAPQNVCRVCGDVVLVSAI